MTTLFSYLFYPNPGQLTYSDPAALWTLILCGGLIVVSFGLRFWRKSLQNAMTKKLSRTWPAALLWLGIVGILLMVARVEQIQFFAMRFLWLLWAVAAALYLFIQLRLFRARHYQVMPRVTLNDPRAQYLPGRKK